MIVVPDDCPVNCWVFREENCKYVVGEDYTLFGRYTVYLMDIAKLENNFGKNFRFVYDLQEGFHDEWMELTMTRVLTFEKDIFELNQKGDFGFVYCDMRYME